MQDSAFLSFTLPPYFRLYAGLAVRANCANPVVAAAGETIQ